MWLEADGNNVHYLKYNLDGNYLSTLHDEEFYE